MVRGSWIKPGAVVIDVGINPVEVRMALLMVCFMIL
jgi:5,10-methylene-tetrahydrofolate dehydrogenase/methenyl tetrahydrofolate cyclohydrolase